MALEEEEGVGLDDDDDDDGPLGGMGDFVGNSFAEDVFFIGRAGPFVKISKVGDGVRKREGNKVKEMCRYE